MLVMLGLVTNLRFAFKHFILKILNGQVEKRKSYNMQILLLQTFQIKSEFIIC